jgi:tetratricopeptide (TPR) repeat protein
VPAEFWSSFSEPGIRFVWSIAGVLLILVVLAYKFAGDTVDPVLASGFRHIVYEATGIHCSNRRVVRWTVLLSLFSVACFFGGLLLNIERIKHRNAQSMLGWLLIATCLLIAILMANLRTRARLWIYHKLLSGDYDGALYRADLLIRWLPETPIFHFMRGTVLHYAGRLREAEQSFGNSIEKGQNRPGAILPMALTSLGHVLLHLGRFAKATAAFEASNKIAPRYAGALDGLAETLLRQGQQPQRALLLVDNALKLRQDAPRGRNLNRHTFANMWAHRAQALAMLERRDEAAAAIETASIAGDPAFMPGLAATCWRCGVAFRLMNQEEAAAEQFRKAVQLDPRGLYGQLAASALRERPALIESQG